MELKKINHIQYWKNSAEENFLSMEKIFNAGEYSWCLFIGHLGVEKLLKAIYVQNVDYNVPRIHDLLKLAKKADLSIDEDISKKLQYITLFNIETRYQDYKLDFKKKCTRKYTEENINKILEIREWLLKQIES